jgi:hypothetical protein
MSKGDNMKIRNKIVIIMHRLETKIEREVKILRNETSS